jgi:Mg2+/Co2+ transporter CorB
MAINRHRLKHLANKNALGAKTTQGLLAHTDQLLSVVLIGNNLFNTIIPVLTTSIALHTFGRNNVVLSIATGIVAFLIIVFAEITPKIVGATFPEKIALPASLLIAPSGSSICSRTRSCASCISTPKARTTNGFPPKNCAPSCSNRAASCRPSTAAFC